MLFDGRNEVPFSYSAYGYTRSNGSVWHGGIDVVGLDSDVILMPSYNGNSISGSVVTQRIVTDKNNLTWQWGYYVCVKLHSNQTPDIVNYLYFCHNKENLVKVGQTVKTGDAIAIMGNTGNAEFASPPIPHVHFEVRSTSSSVGLNPTAYVGLSNKVGIYGTAPSNSLKSAYKATVLATGLRLRTLPNTTSTTVILHSLTKGEEYEVLQTKDGWAFLKINENCGGWACINLDGATFLNIEEIA